ncbi:MAG: hypothetical protein ACYTFA_06535 [Planctomycetota bacterium]
MRNTSYLQTQTIRQALEFALAKGGFDRNGAQKKAAKLLLQQMKSTSSVSGRHEKLRALLGKGATIDEMIRATGSSRRTVFRYLNQFEDSGIDIVLIDGRYGLK